MSYFFRTVPYIVAGAHSLQSLEDSIQFVGNPRSILIVAQNAMKRIGVVSVSAVEAFWTFDSDGGIKVLKNGQYATIQPYAAGKWYDFQLAVDAIRQTWSLEIDGLRQPIGFNI